MDPEELLRHDSDWHTAIERLGELRAEHGEHARERLVEVQQRYAGRRPSMVVDAVMSVQQDYERIVLPLIERFEETPAAESLEALAALDGIDQTMFNNSPKRSATITLVAEGLLRYGSERGMVEEAAAQSWAQITDGLEFAPETDPYIGSVSGIGVALMGYLRLLSGADAIKVDGRVITRLRELGFGLGDETYPPPQRTLMVACIAAEQVGMSRGELDQLLWWQPG